MIFSFRACRFLLACSLLLLFHSPACFAPACFAQPANNKQAVNEQLAGFFKHYCVECHDVETSEAEVVLAVDDVLADIPANSQLWERVVRKLQARQMPPKGSARPDQSTYEAIVGHLESELDREAQLHPRPGRTESLRRLNRTEYQNAIRDLLGLEIDAASLLPADESSGGFDNITVSDLNPTLLDRYISAAQKISRLVIGSQLSSPAGETIRVRADITQEEHVPGLPLGTRGGALIRYNFPQAGEYSIQVRLARDRNEEVEGLKERHQLQILIDRDLAAEFTVKPPKDQNHSHVDAHLVARVNVTAGSHAIGVTFVKNPAALLETKREPYAAHFNMHRHPRLTPAVFQVSITGPFSPDNATRVDQTADLNAQGSPSRQRVLFCIPSSPEDEVACAKQIVGRLLRRAYRRPTTDDDFAQPMKLYAEARASGSFESGIEAALSSILVSPHFLFRLERDPVQANQTTVYQISDFELASRLSFFLWSSLPDDQLLDLAEQGKLHEPAELERQTRRMLADPRSNNLVTNFASQWLYLRNLDSITPDLRLFPDFDDNLRQAFRQETELFFESVMRDDRSVLDLINADYTFLNERLAKHYGISNVYGSRFRRVVVGDNSSRGGLLRHGSILTVTSYATRTSPVIRGHWILKNLVGSPPPPPPANVPALKDNTVSATLSIRQRLAEHRAQAACAVCHNVMDPVGFTLENYDAVGRWREFELGTPIDASGETLDGQELVGVDGLEKMLLAQPDLFVSTLTEKLLTFAIGRGMHHEDAPAIRQIVSRAQAKNYRFSELIVGITHSPPFLMRTSVE